MNDELSPAELNSGGNGSSSSYEALLVVSFGGPEGPDDVMPFLENVLRGRNVPQARMLEVAEHYQQFGGISPLNEQNRRLIAALEGEFASSGLKLPIYWGNRNWRPYLSEAIGQMARDGVRRVLAYFTSAYSSYSGCRQYRENIADAQQELGPAAPAIDKLRVFFNHPGFIEPMAEAVGHCLGQVEPGRRSQLRTLFTAHSIPIGMAENCRYEDQLREAARLVAERAGLVHWELTYQSRSGPPQQPWLEPDICDRIEQLHAAGQLEEVLIAPIGFLSDHLEVLYDLDVEARDVCDRLGVRMHRAATVDAHPRFVRMIRELVEERVRGAEPQALGPLGLCPWQCSESCCLPPAPAARPRG